jgi:type I restriction enzyme M protein
VIGLAPTCSTAPASRPACWCCASGCHGANRVSGKPAERQGKVLFINADREYFEGRAQNYLLPEHIEKIVTTFDDFRRHAGFSAIVDNATLKANDYNLNIRRYADNAPPPEPHDVRAHLVGGVPKAEVAAKAALFSAHGLTRWTCWSSATPSTSTSAPTRHAPGPQARHRRQCRPGGQGSRHPRRLRAWWQAHSARITALAGQMAPPASWPAQRPAAQLQPALEAVGLLDRFQVRGIVAGFWYQTKYDFLTLMARGAKGVADAWRTSIVTALDDKASKDSPLEHKLVKFLMSDFRRGHGRTGGRKAELDSQIKAATPDGRDAEGDDGEGRGWRTTATTKTRWTRPSSRNGRRSCRGQEAAQGQGTTASGAHRRRGRWLAEAEAAAELLLTILHNDMRPSSSATSPRSASRSSPRSRTGGTSTG